MTIAMTPSLFKQLVVASLAVPVVGMAIDLVRSPAAPSDGPPTMYDGILVGLGLAYLVAAVAATIGLCFFARWSRPTVLWLTVFEVVMIVFDGPDLHQTDALAEAFYHLSTLLAGAVLAAAYWSPVSRLFEPGSAEADLMDVFS
ncbi:hypothetical protein [Mesorhizobium sp. CN2-181]|uniref:hypothetical protein n=1 Tax=Mesorhizobium yinganensis TaxID=3157707 RepID=UPI0032B7D1FD